MTAVNGRHQARLFEDTRPIRRPARQVRRRRPREWVDAYAAALAALVLLAVALVYAFTRGGL